MSGEAFTSPSISGGVNALASTHFRWLALSVFPAARRCPCRNSAGKGEQQSQSVQPRQRPTMESPIQHKSRQPGRDDSIALSTAQDRKMQSAVTPVSSQVGWESTQVMATPSPRPTTSVRMRFMEGLATALTLQCKVIYQTEISRQARFQGSIFESIKAQCRFSLRAPNSPLNCLKARSFTLMPISVACSCGRQFRLKDDLAGKKVRCPDCKSVISVRQPEFEEAVPSSERDVRTPSPSAPPFRKTRAPQLPEQYAPSRSKMVLIRSSVERKEKVATRKRKVQGLVPAVSVNPAS